MMKLKVRSFAFLSGTPMINRAHDLSGLLTLVGTNDKQSRRFSEDDHAETNISVAVVQRAHY